MNVEKLACSLGGIIAQNNGKVCFGVCVDIHSTVT